MREHRRKEAATQKRTVSSIAKGLAAAAVMFSAGFVGAQSWEPDPDDPCFTCVTSWEPPRCWVTECRNSSRVGCDRCVQMRCPNEYPTNNQSETDRLAAWCSIRWS